MTSVNPLFMKLCIPNGLEELLEGLAREVLRRQPNDIHSFAAVYFEKLIGIRTKAENSGDGVTLKNLIARGKLLDINEESFKISNFSTPEIELPNDDCTTREAKVQGNLNRTHENNCDIIEIQDDSEDQKFVQIETTNDIGNDTNLVIASLKECADVDVLKSQSSVISSDDDVIYSTVADDKIELTAIGNNGTKIQNILVEEKVDSDKDFINNNKLVRDFMTDTLKERISEGNMELEIKHNESLELQRSSANSCELPMISNSVNEIDENLKQQIQTNEFEVQSTEEIANLNASEDKLSEDFKYVDNELKISDEIMTTKGSLTQTSEVKEQEPYYETRDDENNDNEGAFSVNNKQKYEDRMENNSPNDNELEECINNNPEDDRLELLNTAQNSLITVFDENSSQSLIIKEESNGSDDSTEYVENNISVNDSVQLEDNGQILSVDEPRLQNSLGSTINNDSPDLEKIDNLKGMEIEEPNKFEFNVQEVIGDVTQDEEYNLSPKNESINETSTFQDDAVINDKRESDEIFENRTTGRVVSETSSVGMEKDEVSDSPSNINTTNNAKEVNDTTSDVISDTYQTNNKSNQSNEQITSINEMETTDEPQPIDSNLSDKEQIGETLDHDNNESVDNPQLDNHNGVIERYDKSEDAQQPNDLQMGIQPSLEGIKQERELNSLSLTEHPFLNEIQTNAELKQDLEHQIHHNAIDESSTLTETITINEDHENETEAGIVVDESAGLMDTAFKSNFNNDIHDINDLSNKETNSNDYETSALREDEDDSSKYITTKQNNATKNDDNVLKSKDEIQTEVGELKLNYQTEAEAPGLTEWTVREHTQETNEVQDNEVTDKLDDESGGLDSNNQTEQEETVSKEALVIEVSEKLVEDGGDLNTSDQTENEQVANEMPDKLTSNLEEATEKLVGENGETDSSDQREQRKTTYEVPDNIIIVATEHETEKLVEDSDEKDSSDQTEQKKETIEITDKVTLAAEETEKLVEDINEKESSNQIPETNVTSTVDDGTEKLVEDSVEKDSNDQTEQTDAGNETPDEITLTTETTEKLVEDTKEKDSSDEFPDYNITSTTDEGVEKLVEESGEKESSDQSEQREETIVIPEKVTMPTEMTEKLLEDSGEKESSEQIEHNEETIEIPDKVTITTEVTEKLVDDTREEDSSDQISETNAASTMEQVKEKLVEDNGELESIDQPEQQQAGNEILNNKVTLNMDETIENLADDSGEMDSIDQIEQKEAVIEEMTEKLVEVNEEENSSNQSQSRWVGEEDDIRNYVLEDSDTIFANTTNEESENLPSQLNELQSDTVEPKILDTDDNDERHAHQALVNYEPFEMVSSSQFDQVDNSNAPNNKLTEECAEGELLTALAKNDEHIENEEQSLADAESDNIDQPIRVTNKENPNEYDAKDGEVMEGSNDNAHALQADINEVSEDQNDCVKDSVEILNETVPDESLGSVPKLETDLNQLTEVPLEIVESTGDLINEPATEEQTESVLRLESDQNKLTEVPNEIVRLKTDSSDLKEDLISTEDEKKVETDGATPEESKEDVVMQVADENDFEETPIDASASEFNDSHQEETVDPERSMENISMPQTEVNELLEDSVSSKEKRDLGFLNKTPPKDNSDDLISNSLSHPHEESETSSGPQDAEMNENQSNVPEEGAEAELDVGKSEVNDLSSNERNLKKQLFEEEADQMLGPVTDLESNDDFKHTFESELTVDNEQIYNGDKSLDNREMDLFNKSSDTESKSAIHNQQDFDSSSNGVENNVETLKETEETASSNLNVNSSAELQHEENQEDDADDSKVIIKDTELRNDVPDNGDDNEMNELQENPNIQSSDNNILNDMLVPQNDIVKDDVNDQRHIEVINDKTSERNQGDSSLLETVCEEEEDENGQLESKNKVQNEIRTTMDDDISRNVKESDSIEPILNDDQSAECKPTDISEDDHLLSEASNRKCVSDDNEDISHRIVHSKDADVRRYEEKETQYECSDDEAVLKFPGNNETQETVIDEKTLKENKDTILPVVDDSRTTASRENEVEIESAGNFDTHEDAPISTTISDSDTAFQNTPTTLPEENDMVNDAVKDDFSLSDAEVVNQDALVHQDNTTTANEDNDDISLMEQKNILYNLLQVNETSENDLNAVEHSKTNDESTNQSEDTSSNYQVNNNIKDIQGSLNDESDTEDDTADLQKGKSPDAGSLQNENIVMGNNNNNNNNNNEENELFHEQETSGDHMQNTDEVTSPLQSTAAKMDAESEKGSDRDVNGNENSTNDHEHELQVMPYDNQQVSIANAEPCTTENEKSDTGPQDAPNAQFLNDGNEEASDVLTTKGTAELKDANDNLSSNTFDGDQISANNNNTLAESYKEVDSNSTESQPESMVTFDNMDKVQDVDNRTSRVSTPPIHSELVNNTENPSSGEEVILEKGVADTNSDNKSDINGNSDEETKCPSDVVQDVSLPDTKELMEYHEPSHWANIPEMNQKSPFNTGDVKSDDENTELNRVISRNESIQGEDGEAGTVSLNDTK